MRVIPILLPYERVYSITEGLKEGITKRIDVSYLSFSYCGCESGEGDEDELDQSVDCGTCLERPPTIGIYC